jgi:transposase
MLLDMKAYSLDLRTRVLAAIDGGMSRAAAVRTVQVSLGSIKRWLHLRQTSGTLAPRPRKGKTASISAAQFPTLRFQLEQFPDVSLAEHARRWNADHATDLSAWTLGRAIRRLGWSRKKKSLIASERDAWARAAFRLRLAEVAAADVVVIDEIGLNVDLTPRYGRAPRGQRAYASVPRNTPRNTTLIGSCSLAGMGPGLLLSGGVDGATFEAYLDEVLGPSLQAGQIVLMDNLSAHIGEGVAEAVAKRGCQVWYLPTYSPDLSPIELAFAKFKELVRHAAARTREALEQAVADAWAQVTAEDLRGFFRHCGYRLVTDLDQLLCS